jgi:hypothetical protein
VGDVEGLLVQRESGDGSGVAGVVGVALSRVGALTDGRLEEVVGMEVLVAVGVADGGQAVRRGGYKNVNELDDVRRM